MKKHHVFVVCLMMCLWSCKKQASSPRGTLAIRLDSLLTSEHDSGRFDGTIVIGTQDSILYQQAIGIANRVWDIPMHLSDRFDICSLDKSFVAMLILQAIEEGKLSLESHLIDLLNTFPYSGTFDSRITIHQLLTHTSGLAHYEHLPAELHEDWFRPFKRKHFTNAAYIDFISTMPTVGAPGAQFYYSSFGYHLLAIILEETYQKSYGELLDEKICKPLHLDHTFSTTANREVHPSMVEAYNYEVSTGNYLRNHFIDLTLGRRTFSTSSDLYKWAKEMSAPSLLSKESALLMQTNHLKDLTPDISYGYGWAVFDGQGRYHMGDLGTDRKYIIHGGATEGFRSMLVNLENGRYIIAFLTNIGDRVDELELTKKITQLLISSENDD